MATHVTQPTGSPEEAAEEGRRLTSRQRRIEEQRRKIETMRAGQRRKRAVWGTAILASFAAVAALVLTQVRPPVAAQGRQFPDEGANHVQEGTPVTYRTRPPTSGLHFGTPADYQFYTADVPPGNWLHTLEHGGTVLLYNPDTCDAACQTEVRRIYGTVPNDGRYGRKKMLAAAYRDMDKPIAVVSWRWFDEMDTPDRDRIVAFYREHVNRGLEDVP